MITLDKYQKEGVQVVQRVWRDFDGAILRVDEGLGKTLMAAAAVNGERTLFVTKAMAVKDIKKALKRYNDDGLPNDMDVISYEGFGNVTKHPAEYFDQFKYIVFDECQKLKGSGASSYMKRFWTFRVRFRKLLFMSGTPIINTPKEFTYVVRKTGVFSGMPITDYYIRYFDAKKSPFGDFMEYGPFQNQDCWQAYYDKVSYDVRQEEADPDIPPPVIDSYEINLKASRPTKFSDETRIRVANGALKREPACAYIRGDRKNHRITLTLTWSRDLAKQIHEKLGGELVLDTKNMQETMDRISKEGGHLITTLGLTSCNWDFNSCDRVYFVESTHSALYDRQSLRRCIRRGKRTSVHATYLLLTGERTFQIAASKDFLAKLEKVDSGMGPSSLARLEKCPGSFYYPKPDNEYAAAAYFGTKAHEAFAHLVVNHDMDISPAFKPDLVDAIMRCRSFAPTLYMYDCETEVNLFKIHKRLRGFIDFWAFDGMTLWVLDYKAGSKEVVLKDNLQLQAYAAMICNTFGWEPEQIKIGILQKSKLRTMEIDPKDLPKIEERIRKIVKRVEAAKPNPEAHLYKGKCDFFCPAKHIHEKGFKQNLVVKEVKMANTQKFYESAGQVSYVKDKGNFTTVCVKFAQDKVDAFLKELEDEVSPKDLRAIKATIADRAKKSRGGTTDLFFNCWVESVREKAAVGKAEVLFSVKVGEARKPGEEPPAFFNLQGLQVVASTEEELKAAEAAAAAKPKVDAKWL